MAEQKAEEGTSTFRMIYYAFGGRAEPVRLAASLGGIAFEDEIVTREDQQQQKAEGKRRWSGPPEIVVLDKEGKAVVTLGQSNACLRLIGALGNKYPADAMQRALCDEMLDSMEDLANAFVGAVAGLKDEEKPAAVGKLMASEPEGKFTYWFKKFEARLDENEQRGNKSGLFVGDAVTVADLKAYASLGYIKNALGDAAVKFIAQFARLAKFMAAMDANEQIKAAKEAYAKNYAEFTEAAKAAGDDADKAAAVNRVYKYAGKYVEIKF